MGRYRFHTRRAAVVKAQASARRKLAYRRVARTRRALRRKEAATRLQNVARRRAAVLRVASAKADARDTDARAATAVCSVVRGFLGRVAAARAAEAARTERQAVAVAQLQACWRRYAAETLAYGLVKRLRSRWRRLILPDEAVLLSSPAVWHRNTSALLLGGILSSRRVQLLLVCKVHPSAAGSPDRCRLLVVDLDDGSCSGPKELLRCIPWRGVEIAIDEGGSGGGGGGRRFYVVHGENSRKAKKINFTLLAGSAARFQAAVRTLGAIHGDQAAIMAANATSAGAAASAAPALKSPVAAAFRRIVELNLDNGVENMPVECQGVLAKRECGLWLLRGISPSSLHCLSTSLYPFTREGK